MTALDDDSLEQIWALYDQSGIRPEYILPVLYSESGFRPDALNRNGGASGIGQDMPFLLTPKGIDPADYRTWSAADQLAYVVVPRFVSFARTFGVPRSATRLYQANFLPATGRTARALWSPIAWAGSAAYRQNPGVDRIGKGSITVGDLASLAARAAKSRDVQNAIARAYELRPSAGKPYDPVYGQDFPVFGWIEVAALVTLAAVGVAALPSESP